MKVTKTGEILESVVDDIFTPTKRQREVKAQFWTSWKMGPTKGDPSMTAIIHETGCNAIETWWKNPAFQRWFLNERDTMQRLEYLFDLGIDVLEEVITSAEKASDRLKGIEMIAKLTQKLGKPEAEVKYLDGDVQGMDEKQLEEYIKKLLPGGGSHEDSKN